MPILKETLRTHWLALALALLCAVIVAAPQVAFRIEHAHDGVYKGIEILPDGPWLPRVREIMDGHGFGSIYFKEGKSDPYLFQPAGSIIIGRLGLILGLDINNTILLSKFLFSFAVFILLYAFVYLFSRDKLAALAAPSALLLADSAMTFGGVKELLRGISPTDFLTLSIPEAPVMIYLFLFAALTALWLFYKRGGWVYGSIAAVLIGLNFYQYFYSWTYLFAFGVFLGGVHLLLRDWRMAARIAAVYAGAVIVAIPYGINLYQASLYPTFSDAELRNGIIYTHAPLFIGFTVLIALAVYALGYVRSDRNRYVFGLALLLAPILTLNQQLITGKVMQAGHYHWYMHKPIAVLLVIVVAFYLLSRLNRVWLGRTVAALIIIASFAVGIFVQADSLHGRGTRDGATALSRQHYGPVMDWLNAHAQKDDVLLGSSETTAIGLIYTPLDAFYHHGDLYSLSATNERLNDILLTLYRLQGVTADEAPALFAGKERAFISLNLYGIHYRELLGSYEAILDAEITAFTDSYEAAIKTPMGPWLKAMLAKYEVNWVVWDKAADPAWELDRYAFLHKEATFGDLVIYRVEQ